MPTPPRPDEYELRGGNLLPWLILMVTSWIVGIALIAAGGSDSSAVSWVGLVIVGVGFPGVPLMMFKRKTPH